MHQDARVALSVLRDRGDDGAWPVLDAFLTTFENLASRPTVRSRRFSRAYSSTKSSTKWSRPLFRDGDRFRRSTVPRTAGTLLL